MTRSEVAPTTFDMVYHAPSQPPFFDPLTLALSRRERGSKAAIYALGQYNLCGPRPHHA